MVGQSGDLDFAAFWASSENRTVLLVKHGWLSVILRLPLTVSIFFLLLHWEIAVSAKNPILNQ